MTSEEGVSLKSQKQEKKYKVRANLTFGLALVVLSVGRYKKVAP
jgi:hypothetical protein